MEGYRIGKQRAKNILIGLSEAGKEYKENFFLPIMERETIAFSLTENPYVREMSRGFMEGAIQGLGLWDLLTEDVPDVAEGGYPV